MSKIRTRNLFQYEESLAAPWFAEAEYPWELLPQIRTIIRTLIDAGLPGYTEVEPDVWVGENVRIARTATIEPPVIIGPNTEIRPGAYLRGNVITGPDCVLGNSSELKNCILLKHVQVPHYNYVGDSILGNYAHMGAGSICSNLKSDGKPVVIHAGDREYVTGLRKIGGILGDHADIGSGCILNPGSVIGCRSRIYPLTPVRGVIPPDHIVKSLSDIVEIKEQL